MDLLMQKLCMGKDIGIHGNLFGGIMLAWIDEAAAVYAAQVCHSPNMVTLKVEEVVFKKPVKVGHQIKIYGSVLKMGKTSVTLKMETRKYNVYTQEENIVCTTNIVFVRIDESGEPIPIPQPVIERHS
ncbi:MAG: acyl-CoA thioesterase [Salibacteraceae bacterium]